MANTKYKLAKGAVRTPEEHRKVLQEIDALQSSRSLQGVKKSKKRIANTFGVSSTMYKKDHKPKKPKQERIYDKNRFIQNMGRTDYRD
jgi:hypothetical protein